MEADGPTSVPRSPGEELGAGTLAHVCDLALHSEMEVEAGQSARSLWTGQHGVAGAGDLASRWKDRADC